MGVWCRVTEIGPDEVALAEWSLRGTGMPSIEIIDCLAQLHLDLQRRGGRLVLSAVCEDLAGLLELSGLTALAEA
jgi:hypothetical protein